MCKLIPYHTFMEKAGSFRLDCLFPIENHFSLPSHWLQLTKNASPEKTYKHCFSLHLSNWAHNFYNMWTPGWAYYIRVILASLWTHCRIHSNTQEDWRLHSSIKYNRKFYSAVWAIQTFSVSLWDMDKLYFVTQHKPPAVSLWFQFVINMHAP